MDYLLLFTYLFILVVAFLYASVGHGGASGYIAIMAIAGYSIESIKPNVLILNILVSCIAFIQYYRSGYFKSSIFIPLVLASVPMAFLGGVTPILDNTYKLILGLILIIPAVRFVGFYKTKESEISTPHSIKYGLLIGAVLGYISGLTGIGGGILLSPILLWLGWTNMKQTAALSAGFIFLNSISGLGGLMINGIEVSDHMAIFISLAFIGGIAGSYYGANKFNQLTLSKILGVVLFIASLKLLFT